MHGLLMEVDLVGEIFGMRANAGPGKKKMKLVGALPFLRSELEAECFYVGGQPIGFVEAYEFQGMCHCRDELWQASFAERCAKER